MTGKEKRDYIDEAAEGMLVADGLDEAIIGTCCASGRVVYSMFKAIGLLMAQGMTYDEAVEYFMFNVAGAYLGEGTPIFVDDIEMGDA